MYIGDLHIHSRYSRATSKELTPEHLDLWAGKKGINIVGTGDFTHPAWRAELAEKLEPAEPGLYMLKKEYSLQRPAIPFCPAWKRPKSFPGGWRPSATYIRTDAPSLDWTVTTFWP